MKTDNWSHPIPNGPMARGNYKRRGRLPFNWETLPVPEEVKKELAQQYKPFMEGSISGLWLECGGISCSYLRFWLGKPGTQNRRLLLEWKRPVREAPRRSNYLSYF